MNRPVQSVGHNDTKVLVRILNHDGTVLIVSLKSNGVALDILYCFVLLTARLVVVLQ